MTRGEAYRNMTNRKRAAILGATGMVGRRFAELLVGHPWFDVALIVGSRSSAGQSFRAVWEAKEASLERHYGPGVWQPRRWAERLPDTLVGTFEDIFTSGVDLVFSSVPENAGESEQALVDRGFVVFSNSPYGRFDDHNPLVVPEVNRGAMRNQRFIKNPNCVTSGLVLVLAPIWERYGLTEVSVTTYQSLSGRGDAKYARDLVIGNVLPLHGSSENTEVYIRKEVKKILSIPVPLSVSCHRVGVQEGHYVDVRLKTARPIASQDEVIELLRGFNPLAGLGAPTGPASPIVVVNEMGRPRPSQDAHHHGGMAIAVGNISTRDEVYDLRLSYVVNNLVRGAAGGAILNAEVYFAPAP